MNDAVIGVGSNINPRQNVKKAIKIISEHHKLIATSKISKTKPIGLKNQPDFINAAVLISTKNFSKEELKSWLKTVEDNLGRVRTKNKNSPRTIDLDILVWNEKIVDKDVYQRDFLKEACKELLPNLKF